MQYRYITFLLIFILFSSIRVFGQIDVTVEGISDGVKNSAQRDRDEAILDAKLKAIECAGIQIEAVTVMENFRIKKDWVESKSKGIILPGFQIIDVGYDQDGLYHIVLSGKVSSLDDLGDSEGDKKFRMAKLYLENDRSKGIGLLRDVFENYSDCEAADDALYLFITNTTYYTGYTDDYIIQLKSYYPESKYIDLVDNYICQLEIKNEEWRKRSVNYSKIPPEFIIIPSGKLQMGSIEGAKDEKPVHEVEVKAFQMMTTEVTEAQWYSIIEPGDRNVVYSYSQELVPMESIRWQDCQVFIDKLNEIDPGKGYRLPTEAEWEYACKAGSTSKYYNGNRQSDLYQIAWYFGCAGNKSHQVGKKNPNAWGLYDMIGNAMEWCEDYYHENYVGAPNDGSAWITPQSAKRVLRGAGWSWTPEHCVSTKRFSGDPNHDQRGFRLVRNADATD